MHEQRAYRSMSERDGPRRKTYRVVAVLMEERSGRLEAAWNVTVENRHGKGGPEKLSRVHSVSFW